MLNFNVKIENAYIWSLIFGFDCVLVPQNPVKGPCGNFEMVSVHVVCSWGFKFHSACLSEDLYSLNSDIYIYPELTKALIREGESICVDSVRQIYPLGPLEPRGGPFEPLEPRVALAYPLEASEPRGGPFETHRSYFIYTEGGPTI